MKPMRFRTVLVCLIAAMTLAEVDVQRRAWAYVISNYWPDGDNIVMDDVFLPAATWSNPAQFQLSEWNEVDTTDNSHPFRINLDPQFSFGADDGDNTMGFLGEAGLSSQYGLSYASALAWTVCWTGFFSGRYDECDMMLDPTLPWSLTPDPSNFFQSTVLHESGHIRGLNHYNNYLSMQNSGTDKILRGETLYMDDKEGVRQHATYVSELDMVIYNKFHNGTPGWMSSSPTTARVGDTINFSNITVENRGTSALGALRFGVYLSTNTTISTADQLLNTGSWASFGRFTFSTFNWSATVPWVADCGTYYIGGIIDDNNAYAERYEGNNAVAFSNGSADPQPFTILLERDAMEPNDSFATARAIGLPFSNSNLTIDADQAQDFYAFTVAQASRVSVGLSFVHASGDIDLDLRDSSNAILQTSTSVSNSETIVRDVPAGTYYVRAYGFGSGSCNRYAMTVTATPLVSDIDLQPATWGYGNVAVGGSSAHDFAVQNTGAGTLSVSSTTLVTTATGQFSIVAGGGAFSLAPGGVRTVTVRFAPTSAGPKTATLRLTSNDPDESPKDAALSGTGAQPDLRETSVSNPAGPFLPGATFSATDTVLNDAIVGAGASTTRYYLSLNATRDTGDRLLTGSRAVPALGPAGTSSGSVTVTIPTTVPPGVYDLLACADDLRRVGESNETNNCAASAATLTVALPDLKTSSVANAAPAGPFKPGQTFTASDTVLNDAPVGARSSTTRYYLSLNATRDTGDRLLTGTRSVPALGPGATSNGSRTVTIPTTVPPGLYFLLACADDTKLVKEATETNNCQAAGGKVSVVLPDLVEQSVAFGASTVAAGAILGVSDTAANQGVVSAAASTTRYYLSLDAIKGTGDRLLLGSRSVPILAPGATSPGSKNVTIPSTVAAGQYFLLACADDTKVVPEGTETNNCSASTTRVTVVLP